MTTSITALAASEHVADLRRAAGQRSRRPGHPEPSGSARTYEPTVALRLAHDDEADLVRHIAALDDAAAPDGQILLALVDGEPVAAQSLRDGRVVANPFVSTRDAVALLRLRAEHLSGVSRRRRWRPVVRPRFA